VDEQYVLSQMRRLDAANAETVPGFWLVNAKFSFLFELENPGLTGELFIAGQNITNSWYEYRPGYPMPGANVSVGASISF